VSKYKEPVAGDPGLLAVLPDGASILELAVMQHDVTQQAHTFLLLSTTVVPLILYAILYSYSQSKDYREY
jgi:hypothetical protein